MAPSHHELNYKLPVGPTKVRAQQYLNIVRAPRHSMYVAPGTSGH
jgi:hypothetical protein